MSNDMNGETDASNTNGGEKINDKPTFPVDTEWDAVHEETDGVTLYSRDIVRVRVAKYDEYYDLEMLNADGEVEVVRNIAPYRVEDNIAANDGAFCILVPEVETDDGARLVTDGGRVKTVLGVDPMRYDLTDVSDRDDMHLMMDYAEGIGYREVGPIEVLSSEKIAHVRHGENMWSGMSGDISWFVGAVKNEFEGDSE